jgi:glutaminase
VSSKDLAVMGATLADGGVNPLTRERVVDTMVCHYTLAVMTTAGLYETSGDWLYDIGLPGKSRISGGIVTVGPSSPDDKLAGDLGKAIAASEIRGCRLHPVMTRKLSLSNF